MSVYQGSYQTISRVWDNMNLTTFIVDTSTGTRDVSLSDNDDIIPSVWLSSVNSSRFGCSFSTGLPRRARLFLTATVFLEVVVHFLPGTPEYIEFLDTVVKDSRISRVQVLPERLGEERLRWHVLLG